MITYCSFLVAIFTIVTFSLLFSLHKIGAVDVPKRPFAAIVGGSKVSSKISVIEAMLSKVDKLVLGGGMVFTFLKARGVNVGNSLVEDDQVCVFENPYSSPSLFFFPMISVYALILTFFLSRFF